MALKLVHTIETDKVTSFTARYADTIYPWYKSSGQCDLSRMATAIPSIKLFYQYEKYGGVERKEKKKNQDRYLVHRPPLSSPFHRICWRNTIYKSVLIYFYRKRRLSAKLRRWKLDADVVAETRRFAQIAKFRCALSSRRCALAKW